MFLACEEQATEEPSTESEKLGKSRLGTHKGNLCLVAIEFVKVTGKACRQSVNQEGGRAESGLADI